MLIDIISLRSMTKAMSCVEGFQFMLDGCYLIRIPQKLLGTNAGNNEKNLSII